MTAAAFKATYEDWKLIKTRSVVQIVFEVPIENEKLVYLVLGGMPNPGTSKWFEISSLQPEAKEQEKPAQVSNPPGRARKSWEELSATAQAAIRCNEIAYQKFLQEEYSGLWKLTDYGEPDHERAAEAIRFKCKVASRSEIKPGTTAFDTWNRIDAEYKAWLTV